MVAIAWSQKNFVPMTELALPILQSYLFFGALPLLPPAPPLQIVAGLQRILKEGKEIILGTRQKAQLVRL